MTINERICYLRKDVLKLNQTDFAEAIGMKQRGVSYIEQSNATVTEKTIKAICLVYNISEAWLRDGTKPMRITEPTFSLDKFVKDHGGTELELETMKAYFELDPDIRKMLVKHFKERLTTSREEPAKPTMTVEETETAYIKSRSNHVQMTEQSALNASAYTKSSAKRRRNKTSR